MDTRVAAEGKFLRAGDERFLVKGVTYGTFAPDAQGYQFPPARQVSEDFRLMAGLGLNTVRLYTPRRVSRQQRAQARDPTRDPRARPRAWRSPGGPDVRAGQRDSARRRAVAR